MVINPQESRVLYAELKEDKNYEKLADITDLIIKRFLQEEILFEHELGFVEYDDRTEKYYVKYHLTLINNQYSKIEGEILGFKGVPIVRKFKNEHFGTFNVEKVSIFQRKIQNGQYISDFDLEL